MPSLKIKKRQDQTKVGLTMLLPTYLEESVRLYCISKNIPMKDGSIPSSYEREIGEFIQFKLKHDRLNTKIKEAEDALKIKNIIGFVSKELNIESPIEEFLYRAFVNHGLDKHCRPQFEIGKYRVDFAFPVAHLAVECDGKEYHFTEKHQIERDQLRDKYLARKGWRVLHIEGLAIRRKIDFCIQKIKENLYPFITDMGLSN